MPPMKKLIQDKAVELLAANPEGLRYTQLQSKLQLDFPGTPPNTIAGATWNLHVARKGSVFKPTRGLFKHTGTNDEEVETTVQEPLKCTEEQFYKPFAQWIKSELGECTEADSLGGNRFGRKWGTPDVVGVYKSSARDIVKFNPEIVTAEIKINPSDAITAFGQAVAYRLFSSKVYLVEPDTMLPEDQDRIEALCILFGIGLVLFKVDPEAPEFQIRVRARRYAPDMFYMNEFAGRLYEVDASLFRKLF